MKQFNGTADHVRERLAEVRERVDEAARQAGRAAGEVEILVATKYVAAADMGVLRDAGVTLVGENRAQGIAGRVPATIGRQGGHLRMLAEQVAQNEISGVDEGDVGHGRGLTGSQRSQQRAHEFLGTAVG